jgi:transposase IS200 family protein
MNATLKEANSRTDHIHLYSSIPSTITIGEFINVLKANSTRWVRQTFPNRKWFSWQEGYAAFSVSQPLESLSAAPSAFGARSNFPPVSRPHGRAYALAALRASSASEFRNSRGGPSAGSHMRYVSRHLMLTQANERSESESASQSESDFASFCRHWSITSADSTPRFRPRQFGSFVYFRSKNPARALGLQADR